MADSSFMFLAAWSAKAVSLVAEKTNTGTGKPSTT